MSNVKTKTVGFKAKMKNGAVDFSGISKVDVSNDSKGDYHFITFVMDDTTGRDLIFRPLPSALDDSPFWIQANSKGCPNAKAEMKGVVEPLFVSPNGKELTVIDYNANSEELRFALRMVERASGTPYDYDPIMNNQNGGGGGISLAEAATIGIGVAAFGAILYTSMYGG